MAQYYDCDDQEPDAEWEDKLQPCLDIGIQPVVETVSIPRSRLIQAIIQLRNELVILGGKKVV